MQGLDADHELARRPETFGGIDRVEVFEPAGDEAQVRPPAVPRPRLFEHRLRVVDADYPDVREPLEKRFLEEPGTDAEVEQAVTRSMHAVRIERRAPPPVPPPGA